MNNNKIIKFSYHLISFLFLLYLSFFLKNISLFIRFGLLFISVFHLYDTWWFYKYDANAPI
jgi:hypothetical protein